MNASAIRDGKIIGLISAAHFVSHFHILILPPIFVLVKDEFGVSFTALGLALTVFNIVSATLQTPAGFAVDRIGARVLLTAGLLLGATAITVVALFPSYWMLVVAFAFLGLANTVYHPADYAILSATIGADRIGKAFSVHTFSGFLGGAVAPGCMLLGAALWGWQGAFLLAAALGYAVALLLLMGGSVLPKQSDAAPVLDKAAPEPVGQGWSLLFSGPILRNLFFFTLLALSGGGLQNFSVVALGLLHGTPASIANVALSAYLLLSAFGVLVGGVIADRTRHHEKVAAICFAFTGIMVILIGWVDLHAVLLVLAMSAGGLLNGVIQPSRDMIVRSVTPAGSFGKVFGFVSTGFNIGGTIAPLLYGWLLDRGEPQIVFGLVAAFILLSLVTVISRPKAPAPAAARSGATAG